MRRAASILVLLAGCASATRDTGTPPAVPGPTPVAVLPSPASGKYAPARGVALLTGERLADTDACEGCHTDVAAQWRASAHSFASFNNPVYRAVVEKFRKDVGNIPSRFCGGCHDLSLIVDGALDTTVAPDDGRAFAGVNCRACHGITSVTPDGNGSWSITNVDIPLPKPDDAASVARHKAALHLAVRDEAAMCGSCHRAFLGTDTGNPNFLVGQDDFTPWQRSAYAGSNLERLDDADVQPATCQQCHMPLEPAVLDDPAAKHGQIHSHRFLGGHTWMSAMRADPDQLARAQANLRGAASIDVMLGDATTAARPRLDVVVRNLRVGHRFPGGVMDAQDTWIEVTVHDASGRLIAEAGTEHAATGADPTAHRFKSAMVDEHGQPLAVRETNEFRAGAYNATIAPRDAAVVEYEFPAPAVSGPLTVRARLRHRSRGLELQAAACADSRTERGRAFAAHSRELLGTALDPCAPQPITDIADTTTTLTLAAHAWTQSPAPDWRRDYEHGLGLTHVLQERLDEASRALDRALAAAPTPRDRSIILVALGTVAARQGRVDDALAYLDQAGASPAATYMKGEAYALVWRWSSAAPLLLQAALSAPLDDAAWARAAVALDAAGRDPAALAAALHGLAVQPRSQDLLRIQALALRALNAPPALADAAMTAYLDHRTPDAAPRFKGLCSKTVPGCALERNPVHVHVMRLDSPPRPR